MFAAIFSLFNHVLVPHVYAQELGPNEIKVGPLMGALSYIVSGGTKENVEKARNRMVSAIVGVFLLVVVLSIVWTMENVLFQRRICLGLTCPLTIPGLLTPP